MNTDLPDDFIPAQQHIGDPEIDHYYATLRFITRGLAQGEWDFILLVAPAGLGKSYQINQILKEDCDGTYLQMAGYVSPLKTYEAFWKTRKQGDVLFLDDVSGLEDDRVLELIKAATWTEDEEDGRTVSWSSTTSRLDEMGLPEQFEYRGRVILCTNELSDNEHISAMKSRAKYYEMDFSYLERIDIIKELAKVDYKDLSYDERLMVAEWIESRSDESHEELNLRHLFHAMDIYSYAKSDSEHVTEDWEDLALELGVIDLDDELVALERAIENNDNRDDAFNQFNEETGLSLRTFHRRKDRLEAMVGKKITYGTPISTEE